MTPGNGHRELPTTRASNQTDSADPSIELDTPKPIPITPDARKASTAELRAWYQANSQLADKIKRNSWVFGKFIDCIPVGYGGMGLVLDALDTDADMRVAVKVLNTRIDQDPEQIARFHREIKITARLDHPNIVSLHDFGIVEQNAYYTMDLIRGEHLGQWLKEHEDDWVAIAQAFIQIANGLEHAHQRGVIHRDLNPANILFEAGDPMITDFGIAYDLMRPTDLTRTGIAVGTPVFMSPEQTHGKMGGVTARSDIWSLGCILYIALTKGTYPFHGENRVALYQEINEEEPPLPRQIHPNIPPNLEAICIKCIEKNPNNRYESAQSFAADLQRYLDGARTLARKQSPFWRALKRWSHRREVSVIGGILLTALLLIGIWRVNAWIEAGTVWLPISPGVSEATWQPQWLASADMEPIAPIRSDDKLPIAFINDNLGQFPAWAVLALPQNNAAIELQFDASFGTTVDAIEVGFGPQPQAPREWWHIPIGYFAKVRSGAEHGATLSRYDRPGREIFSNSAISFDAQAHTTYRFRFRRVGNTLSLSVEGTTLLTWEDLDKPPSFRITHAYIRAYQTSTRIGNISLLGKTLPQRPEVLGTVDAMMSAGLAKDALLLSRQISTDFAGTETAELASEIAPL